MPSPTIVRPASSKDIDSIVELDPIAKQEPGRRSFIAKAIGAGQCWVAAEAAEALALLGYGVLLNNYFFEHDFIPLMW